MRAADAPPVRVSLSIDGVAFGEWTLGIEFTDISVPVRGNLLRGDGHVLEIRSDTWIPQASNVGDDNRRLGVLVDKIALSTEAADD